LEEIVFDPSTGKTQLLLQAALTTADFYIKMPSMKFTIVLSSSLTIRISPAGVGKWAWRWTK